MIDRKQIDDLLDWMVAGAQPSANAREIVEGICTKLCASGVPLERMVLFIYTLHPNISGRRFLWNPGQEVDMAEAPSAVFTSDLYHINPLPQVIEERISIRRHLADPDCPNDYKIITELREQGFTDYVVQPLNFTTRETHAVSWSTKALDGFSDEDIEVLERVCNPLARLTETYMLRLNAATLLSVYVGRQSGDKILRGAVHRGDGEEITAVILFVDLKNFTHLSNSMPGSELISQLNAAFDCLVPPVEENGGEILKYMGDGFFAIFPYSNSNEELENANCAMDAVRAGEIALEQSKQSGSFSVRSAIHSGSFHYGNIGGSARLDFTAIGPAVNYTARLLSAATNVGKDRVISNTLAGRLGSGVELAGTETFKGFDGNQKIFSF